MGDHLFQKLENLFMVKLYQSLQILYTNFYSGEERSHDKINLSSPPPMERRDLHTTLCGIFHYQPNL